ncbi:hypothetical protein PsYK624_042080 [Phanerochaete sordida]|uniref:Uncharacterized protein n=1 Tax=Phanerochaete sordida TaxID=48140 RepID=A0A9P3G5W2_9APHY|nr:hypothetical protein PsYK624_042080 [Phanerochaete sordida]
MGRAHDCCHGTAYELCGATYEVTRPMAGSHSQQPHDGYCGRSLWPPFILTVLGLSSGAPLTSLSLTRAADLLLVATFVLRKRTDNAKQ